MTGFSIERLDLDPGSISSWSGRDSRHRNWPVVYTLNNNDDVYVGESLNVVSRLGQHLESEEKARLRCVRVVLDDAFNKSACLDLEAYLIQLFSGDGKYRVLNRNDGVVNADYYRRGDYRETFESIALVLQQEGVLSKPVRDIENTDLYKLSPYKSLTSDQELAVRMILETVINDLATTVSVPLVIQGDPGTGKTIIAVFVMKLMMDIAVMRDREDPEGDLAFSEYTTEANAALLRGIRIGLVIPQQSLRASVRQVFRKTAGLDETMVLSATEVGEAEHPYDLLIVDEAHRLSQRANQSSAQANRRFGAINERLFGADDDGYTQLDWVRAQSRHQVLMIDPSQSVRPADLPSELQAELVQTASATGRYRRLLSQMRVGAGDGYVGYVRAMLSHEPPTPRTFADYEFLLFEHLGELCERIVWREGEVGLARLVAGYAWEWRSKRDPAAFDIELDGCQLRWNSSETDWIARKEAVAEVGSIHTVQGYDLNYAGVIIGPDLRYDETSRRFVLDRKNYFDRKGKENNPRRGLTYSDDDVLGLVLNVYAVLLTRGMKGTFVYACDPGLRRYLQHYIPSSPQRRPEPGY